MPVSYRIEGDALYLEMRGTYTPADIRNELQNALADPALPPRARFFFDVRGSASLGSRSSEDLSRMAVWLAAHTERFNHRLAMIAESDLHFGLLRMAEVYSASHAMTARVFHTIEEARAWLDSHIDDPPSP